MAEDIVIINSDSEDDDVIPVMSTSCRPSTTASIVIHSEESSSSLDEGGKNKAYKSFPFIREFYHELRATFGANFTPNKLMKIAGKYISILQEEIMKHPGKCRSLAKNVCRTMLLFRALSCHFGQVCGKTPYYLQKISQLLAIYIYLELRYAEGFHDSKIRVAERIVANIHLHLKATDVSHILRIFAYIPHMGKDNEVVTKVFKRLLPEPIVILKQEFSDRLYIQYLIAFYHWKDAESEYEDQQRVIAFANKFMKPKRSLKTSLLYARHLPCYEERDDATQYLLTNMVFFNDLRNASLIDGLADSIPEDMIDLSDDMDSLTVDYAEIKDDDPDERPKLEQSIVLENIEPRTAEWLKKLAARAVELEVKLPPRLTINITQNVECVSLDSSDEEHWVYDEEELAAKYKNAMIDGDGTMDSFANALKELDLTTELPEDSSTGALKQVTKDTKKRPVNTKKTGKDKTHSANGRRITFKGITETDLRSVPSLLSKAVDNSISKVVVSDNAVSGSSISVEQGTSKNAVPETVLVETDVLEKLPTEIHETPETERPESSVADVSADAVVCGSSEIVPEELASDVIVSEEDSPEVVDVVNSMNVTESLTVDPEPTSEIVTSMEVDIIEEPTSNEKESNEADINSEMVSIILTSSAEVSTSMINDLSENATEQPISTENIIDNTEVEKEAVTLSLNTYSNTYESSEESDEAFLSHYDKPPIKTYLRKPFKKPEINVNKSEVNASANAADGATQETQGVDKDDANKNAPNILFSGKVIPLREDENAIGGLTPSYLKVPESVEVSPEGSNVVFSMQGRRLSSFPPLMVMSPNEQSMPDFDGDFFGEGEETAPNSVDDSSTESKSNEATEVKKRADKSKVVSFAKRNQYRYIEPRESLTSSSSLSAINAISSTINKINANKQHYQPSTTTFAQTDISSNKIGTSTNFLKRIIPITTTTSSPDTEALKSAQEQGMQNFSSYSIKTLSVFNTLNDKNEKELLSSRENISLPHPNLVIEKKCTPHFISNIISMEKPDSEENFIRPDVSISDPQPPNNDNRTDDVLAAAEILANGIRLVPSLPINDEPIPSVADVPVQDLSDKSLTKNTSTTESTITPQPPTVEETVEPTEQPKVLSLKINLKRIAPMVNPEDSDGSEYSTTDRASAKRRRRNESIDDYEEFGRGQCSPNNMKRLLSEGHSISLPLKKRRKLSEYSEDNTYYKEEDDFVDSVDTDTVVTPKPDDKPKNTPLLKGNIPDMSEMPEMATSYPSEPMYSIAHFEDDDCREKPEEQRTFPGVPPPRYSDVIRDCRPMAAHQQQAHYMPPEPLGTYSIVQPHQHTIVRTTNTNPNHVHTINIIEPPGPPNRTFILAEPNTDMHTTTTTNVYPSAQPVNLNNLNVGYTTTTTIPPFVTPNSIQYTQTFHPTQQNCIYNIQSRPPPTPTPEHIPTECELQGLINLQNYHMNPTHLNNFLHNRQINYHANKTIMNETLCNQGNGYSQNGMRNCSDRLDHSQPDHQCAANISRRTLVPRCGFCVDCKKRVNEMRNRSAELPQLRPNPPKVQPATETPQSPPRRRGRPRKVVAEPTNRVTRSTNRAGQKKKEDQNVDQTHSNVSECKSPATSKKRKSTASNRANYR